VLTQIKIGLFSSEINKQQRGCVHSSSVSLSRLLVCDSGRNVRVLVPVRCFRMRAEVVLCVSAFVVCHGNGGGARDDVQNDQGRTRLRCACV